MARRRMRETSPVRPSRHGRHGRENRSPVVRPPLPPIDTRAERFDLAVGTASEFLRTAWDELRDVSFEIGIMPPLVGDGGIPRWRVLREEKRIILYRVPIERLGELDGHGHRDDEMHRRMMIEACVFRAAAEYLDRDPWDLGPDRYHF